MSVAAERASTAHGLDPREFDALATNPRGEIRGDLAGISHQAGIAVPDYGEKIARYYAAQIGNGLPGACARAQIPFDLAQFGLLVAFESPVEIAVHDTAMRLDDGLRALVGRFGPVILKNAVVDHTVRGRFHRNIFPPLRFHVDRGPTMPNRYSCFTRDPLDAEQRGPRASSTLFIANIVAWLETLRTGESPAPGVKPSYDLFAGQDLAPLFGNVILEQPWSAPAGTGEIAVLDNRAALHATWHKDGRTPGYRIGARYLT